MLRLASIDVYATKILSGGTPGRRVGEPIHLARDAFGNDAITHILSDERAVAGTRGAVAAGARRDDRHRLPGLEKPLRAHGPDDAGAVRDATAAAVVAAEEAPGRGATAGAVDERVAIVAVGAELTHA